MLAISDIAVQFLHMSDHAYNLNRGYGATFLPRFLTPHLIL
jgi:hypothetical protein